MNEENVVYIYTEEYSSAINKEENPAIYDKMQENLGKVK